MDGPDNMALDAALMTRARRTGEAVLRVYAWSHPTLSLGRNQRTAGAYDLSVLAASGIGVVRRPTGGRALLHHREVTYSVTAPVRADRGASYAAINAILMKALRAIGVPAEEAAPASAALPPSAVPCFAEPSAGELVVGGCKLVGSAQWRDDGAMLQHGSILLDDDQGMIAPLMRTPPDALPKPATLRSLLGRAPLPEELAAALLDAVRALEDRDAARATLERWVLDQAERERARYRDPAWTWRR